MNQFVVKVLVFNILIITAANSWLLPTHLENDVENGKTERKLNENSQFRRDAGDPWSAFKSGWLSHRERSPVLSCKYKVIRYSLAP